MLGLIDRFGEVRFSSVVQVGLHRCPGWQRRKLGFAAAGAGPNFVGQFKQRGRLGRSFGQGHSLVRL
jgi:hypothetical protein